MPKTSLMNRNLYLNLYQWNNIQDLSIYYPKMILLYTDRIRVILKGFNLKLTHRIQNSIWDSNELWQNLLTY